MFCVDIKNDCPHQNDCSEDAGIIIIIIFFFQIYILIRKIVKMKL